VKADTPTRHAAAAVGVVGARARRLIGGRGLDPENEGNSVRLRFEFPVCHCQVPPPPPQRWNSYDHIVAARRRSKAVTQSPPGGLATHSHAGKKKKRTRHAKNCGPNCGGSEAALAVLRWWVGTG